jgi:putative DNA primase/helicase
MTKRTSPLLYTGPSAEDLDRIPAELKSRPQWVLFLLLEVPDKHGELKLTKIPVNPHTLDYASTTNPKTSGSYDPCVAALPRALARWDQAPPTEHDGKPATYRGVGLGFVFTPDDPYMLVDLDHSVAPETSVIASWAQAIIDTLHSYTQRSVSGTGLHVLVQAQVPTDDKQHGDVQMWHKERFCAMTGWHFPETPRTIELRQSQLTMVHAAHILMPKAAEQAKKTKAYATQQRTSPNGRSPRLSDHEIITIASRAENSAKFNALWGGDSSGYTSASEADQALLCLLAFYTRDEEQLDSLFRQSGLFDKKWETRQGYRDKTIANALDTVTKHYDPIAYAAEQAATKGRNGHAKSPPPEEPQAQTEAPSGDSDPLPYSDYTNALSFAREHGHNLRYCFAWRSWLVWTGTHWERDDTGRVHQLAKQTIKKLARRVESLDKDQAKALLVHVKKSLSKSSLDAMVRTAQDEPGIPIKPETLDGDIWLLNCANGTLDLRTGKLRPHRQADLLSKCLPIAYDSDAKCPTWERFLWRIMGGTMTPDDPDMSACELENRRKADERATALITFLQRAIGYTLTGSTREQCIFILQGPTKTGKSTFLATIRSLLGPYGQQADMESFMHKDRQEVRNDLADLAGSRSVCALEGQEGRRLAEALIKQMTGGVDLIKARFLFQEHFTFKPQFKVFLGTNPKPVIKDTDNAIWERIRLVPFRVFIPPQERDKTLDEQLQAELPGILAWAVKGCLEWQRLGELREPEAVVESTATYRNEMDTLGAFLTDCCHIADYATVKATTLASAYQAWCKRTSEPQLSNLAFISAIEQRGYERKRGHANQYYWHGLGLVNTEDEPQK